MKVESHIAFSAEETHELGKKFAQTISKNAVIAFCGDLGAGKTTFIRGFVEGIGSVDPREVNSPTFSYLNIYQGDVVVYHFDLYRLPGKEAFFSAGFNEYFTAGGICCLEWAEKMEGQLPEGAFNVTISYLGEMKRHIEISRWEP